MIPQQFPKVCATLLVTRTAQVEKFAWMENVLVVTQLVVPFVRLANGATPDLVCIIIANLFTVLKKIDFC